MKKYIYSFTVLLFTFFVSNLFAQAEIFTGKIAVSLGAYGIIKVKAPDANTYQLDRVSILIGGSKGTVFNYISDAENVIPPKVISNPTLSDYEVYGVFDNSYSNAPPAYNVAVNIYGWANEGFAIAKFKVTNIDSNKYNTPIGFEVQPYIDGAFGGETVQYLMDTEAFRVYKNGITNTGMLFLNQSLSSLKIIDWFDGYDNSDSLLYANINYGKIDAEYTGGENGTVDFPATDTISLAPVDSTELYIAFAAGADSSAMASNLIAAEAKYNEIFVTAVKRNNDELPIKFSLSQNYPNPFNPSTNIDFAIPKKNKVELAVYNILGEKVAILVNKELAAGNYKIKFNASEFPSGVYFYTLTSGHYSISQKMILIK